MKIYAEPIYEEYFDKNGMKNNCEIVLTTLHREITLTPEDPIAIPTGIIIYKNFLIVKNRNIETGKIYYTRFFIQNIISIEAENEKGEENK